MMNSQSHSQNSHNPNKNDSSFNKLKSKNTTRSAKETDEIFNSLALRGMPGLNTSALNQQALEKLSKEREEKRLQSQRKLKKLKNTTSTQDLYLKNLGTFRNFNFKPLKEGGRQNSNSEEGPGAFIDAYDSNHLGQQSSAKKRDQHDDLNMGADKENIDVRLRD